MMIYDMMTNSMKIWGELKKEKNTFFILMTEFRRPRHSNIGVSLGAYDGWGRQYCNIRLDNIT